MVFTCVDDHIDDTLWIALSKVCFIVDQGYGHIYITAIHLSYGVYQQGHVKVVPVKGWWIHCEVGHPVVILFSIKFLYFTYTLT